MGQIPSTYSYLSKKDAMDKMCEKLEGLDLDIYYSISLKRYFVCQVPKTKRYLRIRTKNDIWCQLYYECYLEDVINCGVPAR